ncbi:uncharacterized protein [Amphiura filiformis]|uniref:uncharacterized protein n=1 Tax=Amphiura filiformis TaxID=82378 RepID=UPI003B22292D
MITKVLCIGLAVTLLVALSTADESAEDSASPMLKDVEEMLDFYKRGWEKVDEDETEDDTLMNLVDKRGRRRRKNKIKQCTRRNAGGEIQHCLCNKRYNKKHFLHFISCEGQTTFNGIN